MHTYSAFIVLRACQSTDIISAAFTIAQGNGGHDHHLSDREFGDARLQDSPKFTQQIRTESGLQCESFDSNPKCFPLPCFTEHRHVTATSSRQGPGGGSRRLLGMQVALFRSTHEFFCHMGYQKETSEWAKNNTRERVAYFWCWELNPGTCSTTELHPS